MALNKFRFVCALSLIFFSVITADGDALLVGRVSTTEQEFRFQRMLSPLLSLEPRQCASTCEGHCVPAPNYVCCLGTGGRFCGPGERCCGSENCAPSTSTCCPGDTFALPGEFCCPNGGACPIGTRCDGIYCRAGSGATGTGQTSGSSPTSIIPPPSQSTTEVTVWRWYYFTITWYYYTWYYSYDVFLGATDVFSSTVYSTTTLSVSTSDSAAASAWFTSISKTISLPTPASATPLPKPTSPIMIPSLTSSPTIPPVTAITNSPISTSPSTRIPPGTTADTFGPSQSAASTTFAQVSSNAARRLGIHDYGTRCLESLLIAGSVILQGILMHWL